LNALFEKFSSKSAWLVCNEREKRVVGNLRIIPCSDFFEESWAGKTMSRLKIDPAITCLTIRHP